MTIYRSEFQNQERLANARRNRTKAGIIGALVLAAAGALYLDYRHDRKWQANTENMLSIEIPALIENAPGSEVYTHQAREALYDIRNIINRRMKSHGFDYVSADEYSADMKQLKALETKLDAPKSQESTQTDSPSVNIDMSTR